LYLYFLGLSFRSTSKALEPFNENKRSHVSIWNWVQRFNPKLIYSRKRRVTAFIIDETMIQIGPREAWLWVAIEPVHSTVLGIYLSRHRNMLVVESFLRSLIKIYGRHILYIQTVEHGTQKHVFFWVLSIGYIHHLRKTSSKELYNTSKIEQRILTITIRVGILGVILIMYTTGQDYSCLCIMLILGISNLVR
jgi:hypothetical protein